MCQHQQLQEEQQCYSLALLSLVGRDQLVHRQTQVHMPVVRADFPAFWVGYTWRGTAVLPNASMVLDLSVQIPRVSTLLVQVGVQN